MKLFTILTLLATPTVLFGCGPIDDPRKSKGGGMSAEDAAYLENFDLFGNIVARDGALTLDNGKPQTVADGQLLAWRKGVEDVWYVRMTPSATNSAVAMGDGRSNESFVALKASGRTGMDLISRLDGQTKVEKTVAAPWETGTMTLYRNGRVHTGYVGDKMVLSGSVDMESDGAAGGVLFQSNSMNYNAAGIRVVERPTPYIHLSVDDTYTFLRELSQGSYASIFEHDFFKNLKQLHDLYGTVVSLYLFHGVAGQSWTVGDMSPRFKAEFGECSSWLKFGFHAADKVVSYVSPAGNVQCREDYIETLTAIETFAGVNSIDLMPRFTFFSGNKELYKGLKNTKWGLKGCLTADDNRADNAGLTPQERALISTTDDYYSFEDKMYYVKSERRLDDYNAATALEMFNSLCSSDANNKIFAIFVHDYNWTAKFDAVNAVMSRAKQIGIRSDYPMNNIPFQDQELE